MYLQETQLPPQEITHILPDIQMRILIRTFQRTQTLKRALNNAVRDKSKYTKVQETRSPGTSSTPIIRIHLERCRFRGENCVSIRKLDQITVSLQGKQFLFVFGVELLHQTRIFGGSARRILSFLSEWLPFLRN